MTNSLNCEDWRSRDKSWDCCRIALHFSRDNKFPFWEMPCADEFVGNPQNDNSKYCFAKPGEVHLLYLPSGGSTELDLETHSASFQVRWFNPREGCVLPFGTVREINGPGQVALGLPLANAGEDWAALVRE